ncbi:MAG: hemerythrin family protein [Alphaproteobacteria bacterium]|jgi:hemerythrin|nr:hemerythrin family protein [Alphaproteobacteria bacterium]MBT4018840.1 hemerythrin family protein [Alphaproteobacteria bacterium]MBT4965577.1 hemerythrin family protein [Alphaproteobacteria bacterium]MBT5159851.1 hemerythrin family protein [Alphaproteobacteria bacterium]MBT6387955.1 hemerythrin family protein [Alphaproteobacteria bacterium]
MFGLSKLFAAPEPPAKASDDFMPWLDSYKLGIRAIDADHRTLFDLVNSFERSVRMKESTAQVAVTLDALESYVAEHFAREEKYLEVAKYPATEAHKVLHRDLEQDIKDYRQDYLDMPEDFDTDEFLRFLSDWLKDHIQSEDLAYVPFVKGAKES